MSYESSLQSCARPKERLTGDHVTIVMATLNGGWAIDAQLESIARQTHRNWSLIVSDDGSDDDTLARVARFADHNPERRIVRLRGPGRGSAMNFLSLLRAAGASPWLAFSDQDDVWLPDRLERGLKALADMDEPAVFGSRTIIASAHLTPQRLSPRFTKPTSFRNALVQNVAGGNSMLLNRAALDVLQPASLAVEDLIAHDWWAYQAITAVGGRMILGDAPTLLYRQHAENQIGANDTLRASLLRLGAVLDGRFAHWLDVQTAALTPLVDHMTPEAHHVFTELRKARQTGPLQGLRALKAIGLYRQSARGTAAMWGAAAIGRL